MPVQEDIRDHDYYGPLLRKENARGRKELLLDMIAVQFGAVPPLIPKRLEALSPDEIRAASRRLPKTRRIEDLFD